IFEQQILTKNDTESQEWKTGKFRIEYRKAGGIPIKEEYNKGFVCPTDKRSPISFLYGKRSVLRRETERIS
ncbi:hypothetical protein, partial [Bacteroides salyersiae]|uniref:hypothetical protein n=1 Tax=Bacteroides salyersiae TaxID=291644 RepID=UPI001C8B417C